VRYRDDMTLEEFKKALQAIRQRAWHVPIYERRGRELETRSLKNTTQTARGRFFRREK
tara:strand:+ start:475 stop:648 length:174 start_codon:yes stop_codon:yes gene_type:complete